MTKTKPSAKIKQGQPTLVNAAKLIAQRVDELLAYEFCLASPDNVYKLHEMRIAGKRLRYTMEVFQPVYLRYTDVGAEFSAALLAVKNLQEHLGILHDADVLVPQILEHLARLAKAGYGLPADVSPDHTGKGKRKSTTAAKNRGSSTKSEKSLPIVGVHQVDYAACEGLLTLCAQIRAARDVQYAKLTQEWQQMRDGQVFERLYDLLTRARQQGADEGKGKQEAGIELRTDAAASLPELSTGRPLADMNSQPSTFEDSDAANRQTPQIQRAPGEPGHVAAARRRVPQTPSEPGNQTGQGKQKRQSKQKGDPAPAPRSRVRADKSGNPLARNGTARGARHSRTGADPGAGAGKGGAK